MLTVYCPVINDQINGDRCLEIVLVTDNEASEKVLPESVKVWNEEQRQKCLNCPYHDDLN